MHVVLVVLQRDPVLTLVSIFLRKGLNVTLYFFRCLINTVYYTHLEALLCVIASAEHKKTAGLGVKLVLYNCGETRWQRYTDINLR